VSIAYNLGSAIQSPGDPDAVALIDLSAREGPATYSYRRLDQWCDAAASGLRAQGLQTGDRIAIASTNRAEYLVAFLGAMRAGLVPVPVNVKLPRESMRYIVEDSDAKLLLVDYERIDLSQGVPHIRIDTGFFTSIDAALPFRPVQPAPRGPAMFLYTSGSTGKPKGVVLSHESHLWVLEKRRRNATTECQRVLVAAPLYHMNALSTTQAALAQGDSVVLLPSFTVDAYIDAIGRYRCTALTAVPTMIALLLQQKSSLSKTNLSSVRSIRMGSAPVSAGLYRAAREQFPDAQIANVYGTTEAGPISFVSKPQGVETPQGSLGYPHPEVQMRLRGTENSEAGQGVLEIKSPALMNEYHKLPELTETVLTRDGYYITGDVFRRDEQGFYYFVGRTDDMFVCGGENIYPNAVEKILESHPDVEQASVVPVPDEMKWQKPVAFVVPKPGATVTEKALKEFTLRNGPAYQHPRRIWSLEAFPLSGTNKVDKSALLRLAMKKMEDEMAVRSTQEEIA
jgi:acyl-CoA synthetase (AMP-forming)/AMP-acid ligase II